MKQKTTEELVADKLRKKKLSILDYIIDLKDALGLSQVDLADRMGVKAPYLSRVLNGLGINLTLETIAKFEVALDTDVLVTPIDYEEQLVQNAERLLYLVDVAKTYNRNFKNALDRKSLRVETFGNIETNVGLPEVQGSKIDWFLGSKMKTPKTFSPSSKREDLKWVGIEDFIVTEQNNS